MSTSAYPVFGFKRHESPCPTLCAVLLFDSKVYYFMLCLKLKILILKWHIYQQIVINSNTMGGSLTGECV